MTTQRTWLWIGSVIAAAAVALALGMPPGTLFILALILVCPFGMYFMMGGMGRQWESDHGEMSRHSDIPRPRRILKEDEHQTTQTKYGGRP